MLQRFSAEDEGEFFCECPLALCARRVARGQAGRGAGGPGRAEKGAEAGGLVLLSQDEARSQMVPTLAAALGVKGHRPVVGTRDCKDVLYVFAVLNLVSGAVHANTPESLQAENRKRAVSKTRRMQRAFAAHAWPQDERVRVRIGLHCGEAESAGDGYVGIDVHRASRICQAAHGGQVLVSAEVARSIGPMLKEEGFHLVIGYQGMQRICAANRVPVEIHQRYLNRTPSLNEVGGFVNYINGGHTLE